MATHGESIPLEKQNKHQCRDWDQLNSNHEAIGHENIRWGNESHSSEVVDMQATRNSKPDEGKQREGTDSVRPTALGLDNNQ